MSNTLLIGTPSKENVSKQESKDFISLKSSDSGVAETGRKRNFKNVSKAYENESVDNNSTLRNVDEKYCRVCGDISSGNHYGASSCDGCRGFFKRCVRYGSDYVCLNPGGSCSVDCSSRTRCQACRYQKCLAVGMLRAAVQNPRILDELSKFTDLDGNSPQKLRKIDSNENCEEIKFIEVRNGGDHVCQQKPNAQVVYQKKSFGFDITNLLGLEQTTDQTVGFENQKAALGRSIPQTVKEDANENANTKAAFCSGKNLSQNITNNNNKRNFEDGCDSSTPQTAKRMRSAFVACDDFETDRFDYVKNAYDAIKKSIFFAMIPDDKITDVFAIAWRAVVLLRFAEPDDVITHELTSTNSLHERFLKLLKINSKPLNKEMIATCVDFVMGLALWLTQVNDAECIEMSMMKVWQGMESACRTSQEKLALICVLSLCLTAMDTTADTLLFNEVENYMQKEHEKASSVIFGIV